MFNEILVLSDFNCRILSDLFSKKYKDVTVITAPYNQVFQILYNENSHYINENQLVITWTQASRVSNEFLKCSQFLPFDIDLLKREVEQFCDIIIQKAKTVKYFFIPLWVIEENIYYTGVSCLKSIKSPIFVLNLMNQSLINSFKEIDNIVLFDTNQFLINSKQHNFNSKYWYFTKTLFDPDVYINAFNKMSLTIDELKGKTKKLLIIDLDNTIWGGVLGDDGIENLILGGHSPQGEAFKDFQLAIKSLKNKGIILAICSKNDEENVINCFKSHNEMILNLDDFVAYKINWEDKVKNIIEIVKSINIGFDSVVFLDDNINERERVKSSIPEVFVPDLPNDPLMFKSFLLNLNCFNITNLTEEDSNKTLMYQENAKRKNILSKFQSVEDWLSTIGTVVTVDTLNENNKNRVLQLYNKTNQMNLKTRRFTEKSLKKTIEKDGLKVFVFYVKDNFGDLGLTAVISLKIENNVSEITDFIMSCRILNRKIEETIIAFAINFSFKNKAEKIITKYKKSERNKICLNFFENSIFKKNKYIFTYNISDEVQYLDFIEVIENV